MNRKRTSKVKQQNAAITQGYFSHPFNDPMAWLKDDFKTPPWTDEKIKGFQDRLDSAFGGTNCIVLAWSGDRRYGDVFLNEKGEAERKPVLLFAEEKINDRDYFYLTCPRWLLLEVHHGSQLEDSWDEASFITNEYGTSVRIRPEKPPEFFYTHLRVIADHEKTLLTNDMPGCCIRMLNHNKICYGRYREPDEREVAYVGKIRENMDKAGVVQRNDTERSAKVLQDASASTRHFIKQAQKQKALRIQEIMLANPENFFADILEKKGSTMSMKQAAKIVAEAFDEQNDERFANY